MGKERVLQLIGEADNIKNKFSREHLTMIKSYDFKTKRQTQGGIDYESIYKNPEFIQWKEEFCEELSNLKKDDLIEEILRLLNGFKGLGDKTRFEKLESKISELMQHIDEYVLATNEIVIYDGRISEELLVDKIARSLIKLQKNYNYNSSSSEDTMNDFVRDILDETFQIKDQTRQGESQKGDDAGEVDIQICKDNLPLVMIEALKLDSLRKQYLSDHIYKVLEKYDPNGCPYVVVIVYATGMNFGNFYSKLFTYLNEYSFPFDKISDLVDVPTGYAEHCHSVVILNRNGQKIRVHFFAVHIN